MSWLLPQRHSAGICSPRSGFCWCLCFWRVKGQRKYVSIPGSFSWQLCLGVRASSTQILSLTGTEVTPPRCSEHSRSTAWEWSKTFKGTAKTLTPLTVSGQWKTERAAGWPVVSVGKKGSQIHLADWLLGVVKLVEAGEQAGVSGTVVCHGAAIGAAWGWNQAVWGGSFSVLLWAYPRLGFAYLKRGEQWQAACLPLCSFS